MLYILHQCVLPIVNLLMVPPFSSSLPLSEPSGASGASAGVAVCRGGRGGEERGREGGIERGKAYSKRKHNVMSMELYTYVA